LNKKCKGVEGKLLVSYLLDEIISTCTINLAEKRGSVTSSISPIKGHGVKKAEIYRLDLNKKFSEIEFKSIEVISPPALNNKLPLNYHDFMSATQTRRGKGHRRLERVQTMHPVSAGNSGYQTKDQDLYNDLLKNGYSQKSKIECSFGSVKGSLKGSMKVSMKNSFSSKNKKHETSKILSHKSPTKDSRDATLVKTLLTRNSSSEATEVNRIFGVLKRNLVSPTSQRFGIQQTTSQFDPKREEVRKRLQKHLQLKERELQQSSDTLNLANDTIIIRQNENVDN
jgi:hypothetical protein